RSLQQSRTSGAHACAKCGRARHSTQPGATRFLPLSGRRSTTVWTETPISMTWSPTLHAFLVGKRVVGDGRHLPEERPAVLDQPVSNPLAFSGSPHATLRFPRFHRRGCA